MALKSGHRTKVLVVDDSALMRRIISDILGSDDELEIIDTASNGLEALEKIKTLKPDVVTLDCEMPVMDGLTCVRELNRSGMVPVVMLSSFTKEEMENTIKALEIGAVDFITKPTGIFDSGGESKKQELIEKVKIASQCTNSSKPCSNTEQKTAKKEAAKNDTVKTGAAGIKQADAKSTGAEEADREKIKTKAIKTGEFEVRSLRTEAPGTKKTKADKSKKTIPESKSNELRYIVALGTSTGGPKALQEIIPHLPGNIPAAFLIVQHMPAGFTRSFAERLDSLSQVSVKEAENGDSIKPGFVYLAPGDYHMLVEGRAMPNLRIRLDRTAPVNGHRPSVTVMMKSLADTYIQNVIGVIMTGMGGDGSEGVVNIKHKNKGQIIVQDESSCVVFGMPKAAIQTGVVDKILPLGEIAKEIMRMVGGY